LRNNRLTLVVTAVLALGLVVSTTVAMAQDAAVTPEDVLSTPAESTPMVLLSRTHPLRVGQANVSLTETLGGIKLMVKITDQGRQSELNSWINVYGTGHFGSRGIPMALVSPGVYAGIANLANIDELAVRVTRPGSSRVLYVGIPGTRLGWRCDDQ
jgi:hypothetical protein